MSSSIINYKNRQESCDETDTEDLHNVTMELTGINKLASNSFTDPQEVQVKQTNHLSF